MSLGVYVGVVMAVLLGTLLVGLLPAIRAGAVDPARILGRGATTTRGGRIQRWQKVLCIFQVCLSMGLVGSSAIFVQFLRRQTSVIPYPAFRHIVAGRFRLDEKPADIPREVGSSPGEAGALKVRQWLLEQRGVQDVCLGWGEIDPSRFLATWPITDVGTGTKLNVSSSSWDERYPAVTGLSMLVGRWPRNRGECALSRCAARQFWGDAMPLGRTLEWPDGEGGVLRAAVVGLVQDARSTSLFGNPGEPVAHLYRMPPWSRNWRDVVFLVRSDQDGVALVPFLERALASRNPERVVEAPFSLHAQLHASPLWRLALAVGAAGALALFIQSLGILLLVYYLMEQQRRETGIRMALGARPGQLAREAVQQALKLVVWGLSFGVLIILAGGRIGRAFMLHLPWFDLPSLGLAVASNLVATILACIPALLRLRGLSPTRLLREE
jgi:hypothetical protein